MSNYKYFIIVTGLGIQPQAVGIRKSMCGNPKCCKVGRLLYGGIPSHFTKVKLLV